MGLDGVELVMEFEEEFGIEMDEDEALAVRSVGAAAEYIEGVCKQQGTDA